MRLVLFDLNKSSISSNPTFYFSGYKVFKGQVLDANDLDVLYDGLKENGLHSYDYVLTGVVKCLTPARV